MFGKELFKKQLEEQLKNFDMISEKSWALASNVFVSRVRGIHEEDWSFVFYYDETEATFRDQRKMDRVMQLLMADFDGGALYEDENDKVRIFYFSERLIGSPKNALNCATQLLIKSNGQEIEWFDAPEEIV
jgi:hypothetical protein